MTGRPLRRGLAVTAAVALIALSGCGKDEPNLAQNVEKSSIRVGVPDTVDAAPLYLARKEGYFTQVGLSVEIVKISSNQAQPLLQAKNAKDRVDVALGDYVPIFQELENGAKLRILAEGYSAGPGVLQIVTLQTRGLVTVKDLRNRRVAVDPTYPLGELSLAQTLASQSVFTSSEGGLELSSGLLTVVPMPFKQMSTALKTG